MRPNFTISAIIVFVLVAIDQLIKWLVETGLAMHEIYDLLPFLALYRTHNDGIAFSMFAGLGAWPLVVIACAVLVIVLYMWSRLEANRWLSGMGFAAIVAGAIGNIIDRVLHGYVIDYVLFYVGDWSFAIFNFADALISIGAAAIILDEIIHWKRGPKTTATTKEEENHG
ncbi:MAG: signal peptidase II [Pseudomonadota bacterium]